MLIGPKGRPAKFTNWSFGQFCRQVNAPAGYLATLPGPLAVDALTYGWGKRQKEDPDRAVNVLATVNGDVHLRSLTSEKYSRIWNASLVERLLDLQDRGWKVPPGMPAGLEGEQTRKATEEDTGPYTLVTPGMDIAPSGLYASDRDMFAFVIHPDRVVMDGSHPLFRGAIVGNSEVGASAFWMLTFLFDYVCYNHNIWGAKVTGKVSVRHVGDAAARAGGFEAYIEDFTSSSGKEDEQAIVRARSHLIGSTEQEVCDFVFGKKIASLTDAKAAYQIANERERYGDPRCVWGMVNGLTEVSQSKSYANERTELDRNAAKLMQLVF